MIAVYPTDTAYAIGCDAREGRSVNKIFQIKGREESKTFPLIAADIGMVQEWCEFSSKANELARQYWPGPLTLILPVKKQGLSQSVISNGSVAIRVPDSIEARELSREIGAPIVSTSANKAAKPNCYLISQVKDSLKHKFKMIDRVIDAGKLDKSLASTIVKVHNNDIEIIRQGEIKIKNKHASF
ncbi:MAG: L-threonylcarbamoyladenylate synthase [Patescibacteria group bacterium]|jgi:L-threonylcarbamoyladenylate synthase|nr:L-threonylcarbamoyladenylate synthase [Patescibacteria group bacterium]|tara:strand:+ start:93 stop:647 length:555 start_codon:yes stop_codon:yes gene_type:complete